MPMPNLYTYYTKPFNLTYPTPLQTNDYILVINACQNSRAVLYILQSMHLKEIGIIKKIPDEYLQYRIKDPNIRNVARQATVEEIDNLLKLIMPKRPSTQQPQRFPQNNTAHKKWPISLKAEEAEKKMEAEYTLGGYRRSPSFSMFKSDYTEQEKASQHQQKTPSLSRP
jgi:hypothetical protein